MNKLMKISSILLVVLLFLTTISFATDISMNLPSNTVLNQSNTQANVQSNMVSNAISNNTISDDLTESDNIPASGTSTTVKSVTSTSSDEGLTFGAVLNILLIVVGVVLILLGIAIIIRLK